MATAKHDAFCEISGPGLCAVLGWLLHCQTLHPHFHFSHPFHVSRHVSLLLFSKFYSSFKSGLANLVNSRSNSAMGFPPVFCRALAALGTNKGRGNKICEIIPIQLFPSCIYSFSCLPRCLPGKGSHRFDPHFRDPSTDFRRIALGSHRHFRRKACRSFVAFPVSDHDNGSLERPESLLSFVFDRSFLTSGRTPVLIYRFAGSLLCQPLQINGRFLRRRCAGEGRAVGDPLIEESGGA